LLKNTSLSEKKGFFIFQTQPFLFPRVSWLDAMKKGRNCYEEKPKLCKMVWVFLLVKFVTFAPNSSI